MNIQTDIVGLREEASQAGERIYEQKLRSLLEPVHNGQIVAIHIPRSNYFLGDTLLEAADRLREKFPNVARGEVYARGIGERAVIRACTPRVTRMPQ